MKTKTLLWQYTAVLSMLLFFTSAEAQTTNLGNPKSWNSKIANATLPVVTMPSFNLQQALLEDSIVNAEKSGPWRFGFNHDVNLGTTNSGLWTNLPNGDRVWRIELFSQNALSMNVIFDDLFIPAGASIYLYTPDKGQLLGAYTEENNNDDGQLGTELLNTDRIIIEYHEPNAVLGTGVLNIGTVTHGYKNVKTYGNRMMKALNSSGDCNIDILCPLGVGWEDQAAAVAMIVVGGNGICTGTLINNTLEDGTPYFLTANHCGTTGGATWAFRFHWNSPNPSCATTTASTDVAVPTAFQTVNGATLRASNSGSDFCLWEIDNLPLATAQAWNLYFAGWDNSSTPATQGTGIHHPSGDIKKICRDDNSLIANVWNFNGDANTQIWRVDAWEQGVTEPGSSGSAIFNQNGLIVGQLAGGSAACSGTSAVGYDGYGRLDVSWDGASAAVRLHDWLDPSNSSTTLPGWDPNTPSAPDDAGISGIVTPDGVYCTGSFDPEVTLRNNGSNTLTSATITYDIDGGTAQVYNWTGTLLSSNSVSVTLPTMTTTNGAHTFNVATSLPNGNTDSNAANDSASNPFFAVVGGETVDFTLDLDCWGTETTWEVQSGGLTIYSGGPYTEVTPGGAGTISESWCLSVGCYDFVINDSYGDGMSGAQYASCDVDGTYSIDQGATNLATIIAANSDFVSQEINNFCVTATAAIETDFSGTPTSICPGSSVTYADLTTIATPTGWTWSFPGGTPATSTAQNPTIVYNTAGTYDVTLISTDGVNSDTETKTAYITVGDAVAPIAVCQNINVYLDGAGNASIVAGDIDGGSTDNCGAVTLSTSTTTFTCAEIGTNNVTLTVTDGQGNTDNCVAVVTVLDTISPAAVCQNISVFLDGAGSASIVASDIDGGSTDNCGAVTLSASTTAFTCADLGSNNITLNVNDVNGNTSSCTSVVTVIDTISPTAVCQNINVYLDGAGSASIVASDVDGGSSDNCGAITLSASGASFNCADLGPNSITLTVDDGNGNTSNCVAIVTVLDTISPVVTCPGNQTESPAAGCTFTLPDYTVLTIASDNCNPSPTVTQSPVAGTVISGTTEITMTSDDGNGNTSSCTFDVVLNDATTPTAICQNINVYLDGAGNASIVAADIDGGSTDNCSGMTLSASQTAFTCADIGPNNVTLTATDGNALTDNCVAVVTVIDTISPSAVCQNINVYLDGAGTASLVAGDIDGGSTDNCGAVSLSASITTFTCADLGTNNVTLTVNDLNGNTSNCIATVTVLDTIAPATSCPGNQAESPAAGCNFVLPDYTPLVTSIDNCNGSPIVTQSPAAGSTITGTTTITMTSNDGNGNTSSCTFDVVLTDAVAPTAICQNINVYLDGSGSASIAAADLDGGSTDNCSGITFSASQTMFTCADLGPNSITLTATDGNSNTDNCIAVVTVLDTISPISASLSDVNAECAVTVSVPTTTDNCSGTITGTTTDPLTYTSQGTYTINWTFDDGNGNVIIEPQTIIVDDITNPVSPTLADVLGECSATVSAPTTTDNCSGTITGTTTDPLTYTSQGTYTINWTFDDGNGNVIIEPQTVIVDDITNPVSPILADVLGECSATVSAPTTTDNCSGTITGTTTDPLTYTSEGTYTINWTFDDGNGNVIIEAQTIIVDDITNPVSPTLADVLGECSATVSAPTTTDNCSGTITGTTTDPLTYTSEGTYTINWTFDDGNGNVIIEAQTVIVDDVTAPVEDIASLADVVELCEVTTLTAPTATDNCSGLVTVTNDATLPITASTTVTWTYDDGNGNTTTQTQSVIINGIDVTTSLSTDGVVITSNNTNATAYQWIDCSDNSEIAGETNISFTATFNGDYAVIIDEGSCIDTSMCVTVSTVGINDVSFEAFTLYPNPTSDGIFTISYEGVIQKVDVIDMLGRTISLPTDIENNIINGSTLAPGKYMVRLFTETGTILQQEVVVIK